MLNGLDLFSGIGGLSVALSEWVRPIAYCEIDPYCQGVLLSRMEDRRLIISPIWDDIRTLQSRDLPAPFVDIIYGGFPCQDISVAGLGKGLAGERSGLFWQIVRLSKEILPKFIFLENVPAITSRGGGTVVQAIAEMGYDCRWCVISAASVGALHRRERWFLLGYSKHARWDGAKERGSSQEAIPDDEKGKDEASESTGTGASAVLATESIPLFLDRQDHGQRGALHSNPKNNRGGAFTDCDLSGKEQPDFERVCADVANAMHERFNHPWEECDSIQSKSRSFKSEWWETEPDVGRVADGIPQRVDRLRALGNAVVPLQAKTAFKILLGLDK